VQTVNQKTFLNSLTEKPVIFKLKWGMEYIGNLSPVFIQFEPEYFVFQILNDIQNPLLPFFYCMQLANTEEYIDGQFSGNLGQVLAHVK
jgi:small nuclear ribonucleoprotein F